MKKWTALLLILVSSLATQAQLVQIKGHTASVNQQPYAHIKSFGCKSAQASCYYEVVSLHGVKMCKVTVKKLRQPGASSKTTNNHYVLYEFYDSDFQQCETPFPLSVTLHAGDVIQTLYRASILSEDGEIDEEAINDFVDSYGRTFSQPQPSANEEEPDEGSRH